MNGRLKHGHRLVQARLGLLHRCQRGLLLPFYLLSGAAPLLHLPLNGQYLLYLLTMLGRGLLPLNRKYLLLRAVSIIILVRAEHGRIGCK